MGEYARWFGRYRRSGSPTRNPSAHGEWRGWGIVVLLAVQFNFALLDGLLRGIVVFYLSWRDDFKTSARATAAVSSILTSAYAFSVLLGGVMSKRYGCRTAGIVGGTLTSAGLFASHWVSEMYQLYIAAAVVGIGQGTAFNAASVAIAMHFKKKFQTAYTVAYGGGGVGDIGVPALLQLLLETYGWRGAMLVMSAIAANLIGLSALFRPPRRTHCLQAEHTLDSVQMRRSSGEGDSDGSNRRHDCVISGPETGFLHEVEDSAVGRPDNSTTEEITETVSLQTGLSRSTKVTRLLRRFACAIGLDLFAKSYRFTSICLLKVELGFACYSCSQFIIPRAESTGVTPSSAATLLSVLGVGLVLGRLGSGLLISFRLSAETVNCLCFFMAGVSLLLMNVDSFVWMAVASFVQGFTTGASFTIILTLVRHYVGLERFGVALGLNCIFSGIGALCGPLLSGLLYDVTSNYKTMFYVLAGVYFVGVLQSLFFPLLKRLEPGVETTEHP